MSENIGKKIKELRTELKMTQSELAGSEMTKSMLSHIENGNANPSMKNLQYLAMRLNKPVSYFLQEDALDKKQYIDDISIPIDTILKDLNSIDELIKEKKFQFAKEALKKLLYSYTLDNGSKIFADILYRLGTCHIKLQEFEDGEKCIHTCIGIYISNDLYVEATRAHIQLLGRPLEEHEYNKCTEVLAKAYEMYSKSSSKDVFLEIELLTAEPPIAQAQGNFERTIEVCEKAITLCNENGIYYLSDLSYRMLAIAYLLQWNFDKFVVNMDKAKKYVEFTNNNYVFARICQNYAIYENMINNPVEALRYLKLYEENTDERAFYFYLEVAKAKYLMGEYSSAIRALDKINYNEKIYYLIDCVYILNAKVLRGLIYSKLKEYDKAESAIREGISSIELYTKSQYKGIVLYAYEELSNAYESLAEVYSLKGDFENAYAFLRKSNEIKLLRAHHI